MVAVDPVDYSAPGPEWEFAHLIILISIENEKRRVLSKAEVAPQIREISEIASGSLQQ